MRFVPWYPLTEAAAHTPRGPGLFQIRIADGLVDYPTGKSAMIHYGAASDLHRAVSEFATGHAGKNWLCRHSEAIPDEGDRPQRLLASLLLQFERRFGSPPMLPP